MQQQKFLRFFFLLFVMLYFVQGVITSYQINFFKPHMTAEGINLFLISFFLFVMSKVSKQVEKDKIQPHTAIEVRPHLIVVA